MLTHSTLTVLETARVYAPSLVGEPISMQSAPFSTRLQIAHVADFDLSALQRLSAQNHAYDRLDWWALDEWHHSEAFVGLRLGISSNQRNLFGSVPKPNELAAALLVVPIEYTETHLLSSARNPVAWLRWCAILNGLSPSASTTFMLQEAIRRLQQTVVHELWCISEMRSWLGLALQDFGFNPVDELITMRHDSSTPGLGSLPRNTRIRVLRREQLNNAVIKTIQQIDHAAFESQWQYSDHMLQAAFEQSFYVSLIEREGVLLGYQCAALNGSDAHIVRLAIAPAEQGHGLGEVLLRNCLRELKLFGARDITLNTPGSNHISQRLYRRVGFVRVRQSLTAFQKVI